MKLNPDDQLFACLFDFLHQSYQRGGQIGFDVYADPWGNEILTTHYYPLPKVKQSNNKFTLKVKSPDGREKFILDVDTDDTRLKRILKFCKKYGVNFKFSDLKFPRETLGYCGGDLCFKITLYVAGQEVVFFSEEGLQGITFKDLLSLGAKHKMLGELEGVISQKTTQKRKM